MIVVPPSPLRDIELAFGAVLGRDATAKAIGTDEFTVESPREAFRAVIRDALQAGPCFVAFSGGRDSSTVLAVAVDVAREAAISPPVPVIKFMPDLPASQETDWQELVLAHLGVTERLTVYCHADDDELFGADGLEALQRVGVAYPPAASSLLGVIRAASGGTLLTGHGGDELGTAANSQWAARALVEGRASRRARLAVRLPRAAAGARGVRSLVRRPNDQLVVSPWLTRRGEFALRREVAKDEIRQPISWRRSLLSFPASRHRVVGEKTLEMISEPHGVVIRHPLWERRTLAALAHSRPFEGYPTRSSILEEISSGLLPMEVTRRSTKADFSATPWGPEAEEFIRRWDGSDIPDHYVDPQRLRAEWTLPPAERSITAIPLLQTAWLASQK